MKRRPRSALLACLILALAGCSMAPQGTYFPALDHPDSLKVSHALYRAALATGDDPTQYSFALVASAQAQAWSDGNLTVYVSDGLARLPAHVLEPLIAHEVAHEVLGHVGRKQALSFSITSGFAVVGILIPGGSLLDFVVNPLITRAYSREQELEADARAVEILHGMGYPAPRRALWLALQAVAARSGKMSEQGGLLATHPPMAQRLAALEPLEPPASPLGGALATE